MSSPLQWRSIMGRSPPRGPADGAIPRCGEFTEIGGQRVVRYAQARVMARSCVECHNTHPQSPRRHWQEGDVRGVLEIIRPLDKDEARVGEALYLALLLSAAVSALLLGSSLLVMRAGRRRTL